MPATFPVYEVGPESDLDDPGLIVRSYTGQHKVPPSLYGMELLRPGDITGNRKARDREQRPGRVLTADLIASQDYVYHPHVQNLATIPGVVLESAQPHDPIEVEMLSTGKAWVTHGHHRSVAALLRGDQDILVEVTADWL